MRRFMAVILKSTLRKMSKYAFSTPCQRQALLTDILISFTPAIFFLVFRPVYNSTGTVGHLK